MRLDSIGQSEEGRPIRVVFRGNASAPVRILIVAGQHGDERRGPRAVSRLAQAGMGHPATSLPVALALVHEVNPDGTARGTRANARGVDLNRDHLRLSSAEAWALHQFVRTWRPHLIVDVHDFPPRRRHLLAHQLVYCHDVFLDVPTHPAATHGALGEDGDRLLPPVLRALNSAGYRSGRYLRITRSGRIRHSTPDVVDARNGLSLRYGVPTVLVEGRGRVREDDSVLEAHVVAAIERALSLTVRWAWRHHRELTEALVAHPVDSPRTVPVRTRYRTAAEPCVLAFADARSGVIRRVQAPGRFTPALEAEWPVSLPRAYGVPRARSAVLDVLRRHGFALAPAAANRAERLERYQVDGLQPSLRPDRSPRELRLSVRTEHRPLDDHLLVPVTAESGPALAVFLEPASKHGLARFAEMEMDLTPQSLYPVVRVLT